MNWWVSCRRCDGPILTLISMCANIFSMMEKLYRFGQTGSTIRKDKEALLIRSEYSSRKVSVWGQKMAQRVKVLAFKSKT